MFTACTLQKSTKTHHSTPATTHGSPTSSQHSNGARPVSPVTTQESPAQDMSYMRVRCQSTTEGQEFPRVCSF